MAGPDECARRCRECAQRSHERAALDRPLDGVHVPEDTRHLGRARALIDIRGGAELHETAVREHADPVGDAHRLDRIVRDQNGRRAGAPQQIDGLFPNLIPESRVQARERLVHEQDPRSRCQRSSQRDPLPLAARQHVRVVIRTIGQSDIAQKRRDRAVGLRAIPVSNAEGDVRFHRQVREERKVLKHHADVAPLRLHVLTVGGDHVVLDRDPARRRALESGNQTQRRGLSRTGRTKQAEDGPSRDVERDVVQGPDCAVVERHVLDAQGRSLTMNRHCPHGVSPDVMNET